MYKGSSRGPSQLSSASTTAKASPSLQRLTTALSHLPGIGLPTAERLASYLLIHASQAEVQELSEALIGAKRDLHICRNCFNLSESEICPICQDPNRDPHRICVVATPDDVRSIEHANSFRGRYHVLHGLIDAKTQNALEQLKIRELLMRLKAHPEIEEVVFALDATMYGEATLNFLTQLIEPSGIRLSALATGLPLGTAVAQADWLTLQRAMEQRRLLSEGRHSEEAPSLLEKDAGAEPEPEAEAAPEAEDISRAETSDPDPDPDPDSLFSPDDFLNL